MKLSRLTPVPLYLIMISAASMFTMSYGILSTVYRIQEAGLNPLQLILVGTVLEASIFLFEIPTGIVADVYSRRLSIIIGYFLIGAGFMVEGLFPIFGVILVAQVMWGTGYTFTSGAIQAWISDEVGGKGVGRIFLRGAQAEQFGALIGIGLGTTLGTLSLGLPIFVAGALTVVLALFLILFMPERGFKPTSRGERESWQAMGQTLRGGIKALRVRPILMVILIITLIYGAASEPIDRLWPLHLLNNFTFPSLGTLDSVVWFGIIGAVALVIGIGVTEIVRRFSDVDNAQTPARWLFGINAVHVISIVIFALAGNFTLAVSAMLVSRVLRQVTQPLMDAWTNQNVESSVRATVFSMQGQGDAIGQVAFGPVMGFIATATTIRIALMGVAIMLLPPQILYPLSRRWNRTEPTQEQN